MVIKVRFMTEYITRRYLCGSESSSADFGTSFIGLRYLWTKLLSFGWTRSISTSSKKQLLTVQIPLEWVENVISYPIDIISALHKWIHLKISPKIRHSYAYNFIKDECLRLLLLKIYQIYQLDHFFWVTLYNTTINHE